MSISGRGVNATSFGDRNSRTGQLHLGNTLSSNVGGGLSRRDFTPDVRYSASRYRGIGGAQFELPWVIIGLPVFSVPCRIALFGRRLYPALMAALLVAGSAPGGTRRRLSFRRVERWSDPPQPEVSKSKEKEAVELLLWSDIGKNHLTLPCPFRRIVIGEVQTG